MQAVPNSGLDASVLVLNKLFMAVHVIPVRRAFILLCKELAEVVSLEDGQKLQPGAQLGDFIVDPLPPIEFGRIAAQAAKQVIFQKVREAERENVFAEYNERIG